MSCLVNGTCPLLSVGTAPQLFTSALQFFAATQCLVTEDWPQDVHADVYDGQKFDFIIVGAGSAGSVLANRLSERKDWNILIIEAGKDPPAESIIPYLSGALINSEYNWKYLTTPNSRTNRALKNESLSWPRGKMLGGCSSINGMIYVKGCHGDFESWYNEGNQDWSVDTVERYFKKAENLQNQYMLSIPEVHEEYGHDGPLVINRFNSSYPDITQHFLNSWHEIGITTVDDVNTSNLMGASKSTVTAASGVRQSLAKTYLNSIRNRTNLKVIKQTLVTKVLIDTISKIAYGVEAEYNGTKVRFFAELEVILSAGAINTPQLLMLSGVGPKEHLKSKNVIVIADSPMVGKNLADHITIPITIFGNGPSQLNDAYQNYGTIQYIYNRSGYLASGPLMDAIAFYSNDDSICPKFQNHFRVFVKNDSSLYNTFSNAFRYNSPIPENVVELNKNNSLYLILLHLSHPKSRGSITLKSNDPKHYPIIDPNYFSDPDDLETTVDGILKLTTILDTKYFKSINAFLGRMKWPACDVYEINSREYWKCVCIDMVLTVYHPVGTAKMGPDPTTSVVDSQLRVHGVQHLRVIDASIMPTITSGNTNGPTVMIAERGADLIKQSYPTNHNVSRSIF